MTKRNVLRKRIAGEEDEPKTLPMCLFKCFCWWQHLGALGMGEVKEVALKKDLLSRSHLLLCVNSLCLDIAVAQEHCISTEVWYVLGWGSRWEESAM